MSYQRMTGNKMFLGAISIGASVVLTALVAMAQKNGAQEPLRQSTSSAFADSQLPIFQPAKSYSSGPGGTSVVIADVNGDRKPDLLVANGCDVAECTSTVGVLMGVGNGKFQPVVLYSSGGSEATSLAVADVNGDGKLDLIVTNCGPPGNATCPREANGTIGILLGNGDGTFQPVTNFNAGGFGSWSVATGDLNGDGKVDVVVANRGTTDSLGSVGVLLGNGDGTFRPVVTYDAFEPVSVAVADLNRDGKADVVVTYLDAWQVAVMLGNGNGILGPAVAQSSGGQLAWGVAVGDVNNDGKPDLVVANTCEIGGCSGLGAVGVLLGRGDGTFRPAIAYSTGAGGAVNLAIADVDGDGKPDLVVANENSGSNTGSVGLLLGNGDGTFQAALNYGSGGAVNRAVAAADLNGDGRTDVVATNLCMAHTHNCNVGGGVGVLLKATFATHTLVTTSGSPSLVGRPATFTATVTSTSGAIPDGELVTFYDGSTMLASVVLAGESAAYTTSSLSAKAHTIKASYAGDVDFRPSTGTVKQMVNQYPTTATLRSSVNPSNVGQAVTFIAHVTSSGPSAPTGTVAFKDGTIGIGTATLSAGVAKLTRSTLAVGMHSITAQYEGDAISAKSISSVLNQVVR